MSIITVLLLLYIITKPFYLWASGLPQISDIILAVAFAFTFLTYRPKVIGNIIRQNIHFFIFLIFVIVINLLYSIYYADIDFNMKSLYYIFDALGIIVFSIFFENNQSSKKILRTGFAIALIMQLVMFFTPFGRYYGGTRYMGSFNDPNQFAYFCLLSYSFIYLLTSSKNRINSSNFLFLLITVYLIFQSSSTGMLLGASIFIVLFLANIVKTIVNKPKKYLPYIFSIIILAIPIVCVISVIPATNGYMDRIVNSQIFSRIKEKTVQASGQANASLWEERGYDRMQYYPQYIIYGAGEGQYERFEKAYQHLEFHATLPSILFCYGILPFFFILKWGYRRIKSLKLETLSIYISLILESFTLINSRQVLFWAIFCLAGLIAKEQYENK